MKFIYVLPFILLWSCSNPFQQKGGLNFKTKEINQEAIRQAERENERLFQLEKKRVWDEIIAEANLGMKEIWPIIETKCFACHDTNTKVPFYGRIAPNINPVFQHRKEGIEALDFSKKFPLVAKGNPSQLSLLNAFKNSILERTMPLKVYTNVYRRKKITNEDQEELLAWIDPLIKRIEDFDFRFAKPLASVDDQARNLFEAKCFRCHANGIDRGGFGDMQDVPKLLKSKFVKLEDPSSSAIYTLSLEAKMPPSKRESLTQEELNLMKDWIEFKARNKD